MGTHYIIATLRPGPIRDAMERGHAARHGHELSAILVSENGIDWEMVRLCCGETAPGSRQADEKE